jgi:hypothetical protein
MGEPVRSWQTDWDHADPAWAADPFSIWDELRSGCPVARTERYGGAWLVTTHGLIDGVAHDPATFSSRETGVRPPGTNTKKSPPITTDPPDHQGHRRVLLTSFAPRAVAQHETTIRAYCKELLAAVGEQRRFDAAEAYARHIPTKTVAMLLALPDDDAETFRGWVRDIMVEGHRDPAARERATAALKAYLAPLVAERRGGAGDDVLTTVASAELDGVPVSEEMAIGMAYLLVVAGIDTTWSALGTAIWHLGSHPDDLRRLTEDRSLLPTAVEELLRAYAPVSVGRIAVADTELGGCPVRAGERILLPLGSANRDPATFDRAGEVVIDRQVNHHATFGLGIHRCLGSNLARLELVVALDELLAAFPRFRVIDPDRVGWTVGHVRGPLSVPLEVLEEGA